MDSSYFYTAKPIIRLSVYGYSAVLSANWELNLKAVEWCRLQNRRLY